jgi:hypothetical protein
MRPRPALAALAVAVTVGCNDAVPPTPRITEDLGAPISDAPSRDAATTPDALDASTLDVVIDPTRVPCTRARDCARAPGHTACDTVTGLCVECLPTSDSCAGMTLCDPERRVCVRCLTAANCASGMTCVAGECAPAPLYHGWPSGLAGCATDRYDRTETTILGGRYPYIAGDSDACRAWKLAATVCTTQPARDPGDGNFSCPVSGGFTDPTFGTYCRVAEQHACSTCAGPCSAGCGYAPLSLRGCAGTEAAQP